MNLKTCRIAIYSLLLVLFILPVFSQDDQNQYYSNFTNPAQEESKGQSTFKVKPRYQLSTGVIAGSYNHSGFGLSYINPQIELPLNKKFSVMTGAVVGSFISGKNNNSKNSIYSTFYTSAAYRLNDKLTVNASVVYRNYNKINLKEDQRFKISDQPDFSMGAQYKLSKNTQIGIQFSRGQSNDYQNRGFPNQNPFYFEDPFFR